LCVIKKVKRKALAVASNAMAKKTMNLLATHIPAKKFNLCNGARVALVAEAFARHQHCASTRVDCKEFQ